MCSSRNVVNVVMYLAEQCNRYFPVEDIPSMLETFIPLVTPDVYSFRISHCNTLCADASLQCTLYMIPVMTGFLPPRATEQYMPVLIKLWEALNSSVVDDKMMETCARLSEEHIAATPSDPTSTQWKDIGIWSQSEWNLITSKGLGFMSE